MIINVQDLVRNDLQDEVIIFQTDTVFGIGCLLSSEVGVKRIYEIKKRDGIKPFAVLCSSHEDVKKLVQQYELGERLAEKHWPGGLTLVFPKQATVGDFVTSSMDTVGVRIPNDEIALTILDRFGPMAVTSLNLSTEPAITKYKDALKYEDIVDYIVKGTDTDGVSSTVYDVVKKIVYRQGDVIIK